MTKILLHACCGPCALEPARLLRERGHEIALAYMNPNIHPREEYERRLQALTAWAGEEGIKVFEGPWDARGWMNEVGSLHEAGCAREDRCRACYRMRLGATARLAAAHGFEAVSTTLSVSPYQFTSSIEEELARTASEAGIESVFEDFRPWYDEATARSRAAGMYRQNYCGCVYSEAEARAEREERANRRRALKEAGREARAEERLEEERALEKRRAERASYNAKRRAQKAVLKALRDSSGADAPGDGGPSIPS